MPGETTLALHKADAEHPAGTVRLGICVADLDAFHAQLSAGGVRFTRPPELQFGARIAAFVDSEGATVSVSEERKKGG